MKVLETNKTGLPTVIIDDTPLRSGVEFWLEWKPNTKERQHDCNVYKMQYQDGQTFECPRKEGWE